MHTLDRRTDRQRDRILIARLRLHSTGRGGKNKIPTADIKHIMSTLHCSNVFKYSDVSTNCKPPKFPKRGSITQNSRFSFNIALRFKKVCYKVSLCENCQQQSCRAFIGLTIHAKIIGGGRPLLPEILGQTDRVAAKSPIFDLFSFVAPHRTT